MAKIDKRIAGALIAEVRKVSPPEDKSIKGEFYRLYTFNELQATFIRMHNREEFFGLIFSLFGNEIILSSDLTMITYDEETDEGVSIEDEGFIQIVNQFLLLRLKSLKDYRF